MRAVALRTFVLLCLFSPSLFAQTMLANVGPVAVDFGAVKMGATVSVPVTVHNLSANTVSLSGGGISGTTAFTGTSGSCGTSGYQLAPGASCYFTYTFTPTDASGDALTGTTNVGIAGGGEYQNVALSFSGAGTEGLIQVSPVSIDFGSTFIGQQVSVPVTLTNNHSATVSLSGGGISGNAAFEGGGGTCGSVSYAPAAGTSCSFTYSFTPSAMGPTQVTTSIGAAASSPIALYQTFAIALKGTGITALPSPNVDLWPVSFDFGAIKVGHQVAVSVNYQNNSAGTVSLSGGGFNNDQGGTFGAYNTGGTGCSGSTITSGTTCTTSYVFLPHVAQSYSDSTSVEFYTSGGPSNTVPITVQGEGLGSLARVTPQTIDLGNVAFGTSVSVPVVVTNTSDAPLTNFTGGSVDAPFVASNGCESSLAVGASCAIAYTLYAPPASASLASKASATTFLAFTNSTGIEQVTQITLNATVGDRIFGDGFEGD
jgi:hypothetical protein